MRIAVTASRVWAWPLATVENVDGHLAIASHGEGAFVVPRGVRRAQEVDNEIQPIADSTYGLLKQWRDASTHPDELEAATRLARVFRLAPVPELCAAHGLPYFHQQNRREPCPAPLWRSSRAVRVDHLAAMLTTIDGTIELARWIAHERRPASQRATENTLAWPLLQTAADAQPWLWQDLHNPDTEDAQLRTGRARNLVSRTITAAMTQSRLRQSFDWNVYHRPEYALRADTSCALYVAELATQVVDATAAERDVSVVCDHCGEPFTPARTPRSAVTFCSKDGCQRARRRRNQAAYEARQKEKDL